MTPMARSAPRLGTIKVNAGEIPFLTPQSSFDEADSIKGKLKARSGRIELFCGVSLLESSKSTGQN